MTNPTDLPPHDLAAERALLGALLLAPRPVIKAIGVLNPDDFYVPAHRTIARSILDVLGGHPDEDPGQGIQLLVSGKLADAKELDPVGGPAALTQLVIECPNTSGAKSYARRVDEKARRRDSIVAAREQAQDALHEPDFFTALANAKKRLDDIVRSSNHGRTLVTPEQAGTQVLNLLEERMLGRARGIPTGIERLDRLTGGHRAGEVMVLGARSSQGKTALAIHMAEAAARAGHPVCFASLEMDQDELMERFISKIGKLALNRVRHSDPDTNFTIEELDTATAAIDTYVNFPGRITIHDEPTTTVDQVLDVARVAGIGDGHGLIVVDYLQLLTPSVKGENTTADLSGISGALKTGARELRCSVLALSQLRNIAGQGFPNPIPVLEDLRGSGKIGQDASVVAMIHRPNAEETIDNGDFDIYVRKNRNGARGKIHMIFNPVHQQFTPRPSTSYAFPARDPSGPAPRGAGNSAADLLIARREAAANGHAKA